MRLGFISDLHVDNQLYNLDDYLDNLSRLIDLKAIELLVIGGDIANHYSVTLDFVEDLQKLAGIPVYFVPGNHDFWDRSTSYDKINSMAIYDIYRDHPQSLIESPLKINDEFALVGHTAWYNHVRYNRDRFDANQIEKGRFKGISWQDKKFINWQAKDKEVSEYFASKVETDLNQVQADKFILVTHMVTIAEFTMPMPHRVFDFFNAYIATDDFKRLYDKYPIEHSFMGHVHFRHSHQDEKTLYYANSLGYVKEWRSKDMMRELEAAIVLLDI